MLLETNHRPRNADDGLLAKISPGNRIRRGPGKISSDRPDSAEQKQRSPFQDPMSTLKGNPWRKNRQPSYLLREAQQPTGDLERAGDFGTSQRSFDNQNLQGDKLRVQH